MEKKNKEKSFPSVGINWYPGHMAKTKRLISEKINLVDIVFEVIDARMPYSSKIKDINIYIQNKPKVLIMTKMDLCDEVETNKWIQYYEENEYKVLPLDLEKGDNIVNKVTHIVENIMKPILLKRKQKGMTERKTRILIVGIPNVGKSTLINRLVGRKVTSVGNRPGVTKSLDWIRINNTMELLDTPGVLWPKLDNELVAYNLAAFTAIKEEILPIERVAIYILKTLVTYYPAIALERYGITEVDLDILPTIDHIAKKRGCLRKGGMIDYDKVYSIIMNDIKSGFIKGITFDKLEQK